RLWRNFQTEVRDLGSCPSKRVEFGIKWQFRVGEGRSESQSNVILALRLRIKLGDHEALAVTNIRLLVELYVDLVPARLLVLLIYVKTQQVVVVIVVDSLANTIVEIGAVKARLPSSRR